MATTLKFHPIADVFPLIKGEQFDQLVEDIRANGLYDPIWLHPEDGSIIDGRSRYKACSKAGVEPCFRTWNGKGSLAEFVVIANLGWRRYLNKSQRAVIAALLTPWIEKECSGRRGDAE